MDFRSRRGPYKTNIDPILRHWAHFFGPNAPKHQELFEESRQVAFRLLTKCENTASDERPFTKRSPRLLGELIELVRFLPPYDSVEFKLLHPVIVGIEWCHPLDIERGLKESREFSRVFHELFEKSTEQIMKNERDPAAILFGVLKRGEKVIAPVNSCGFWGGRNFTNDADDLTEAYWRLVLKRDARVLEQRKHETIDEWLNRLSGDDDFFECGGDSGGTVEFDREAFNFGEGLILSEMEINEITLTMDRVGRFGLSQKLADFLMQDPMWDTAKRMADLYEAFYLLHDTAYLAEHGLTEAVLSSSGRSRKAKHTPQLVIDNGNVRHRRSLFWTAITEDDVRAEQIRTCKILDCRKVFWAKAKNQWCCSPRCSNLYHVQNYRYKTEEQKAAYVERQIKRERSQRPSRPISTP